MTVKKEPSPEIIRSAIENNWEHVFIVNSQIVAMVARMAIEAYGIPKEKVICVSINGADTSLVCSEFIRPPTRWFDRFFIKGLRYSPLGRRIVSQLNSKKQKFLVYAAWAYPEVESVLNSANCMGHMYLEEGQLTYYNSTPYLNNKKNSWYHHRKKKKSEGSIDYYFRQDASAYIGLSTESFPMIEDNKRFVLNNFDTVRKLYTPRFIGIKSIGLMPAPHRIPQEYLESAVKLLVRKMPEGGVIKLHPGFSIHTVLRDHIVSILERISNGTVTISSDNIILELEMLSEPKVFFGARSSLTRYAEAFGSKYEFVQFDGYIPPSN